MACMSKLASLGGGALILVVSFNVYAADQQPTRRDSGATNRSLDLKIPSITQVFTAEQIALILARATDPELEHVEVQASRIADLPLEDNSASGAEVAFKEVVRWFSPHSSTLASQVNATRDAADAYRPAPVLLSSYHPSFAAPYSQR